MLATLSRWRSGVQIPSGTLARHGTQSGKAAKLKTSCLAGSTPARATDGVAVLTAACKAAVAKTSEVDDERFNSFATQSSVRKQRRPARLSAQDTSLSRWKDGFDPHAGH